MTGDRFSLADRVAVVTGAGRGLGRFMAEVLAEAGASVVLLGRTAAAIELAAATLKQRYGKRMLAVVADVTSQSDIDAAAAKISAVFGGIDILVNNAGIATSTPLLATSDADWNAVVETNLTGVWRVVRGLAPLMDGRPHGRIVNIGSVMSSRAAANRGPYAAAKAGLLNLGNTLAIELGPMGVNVNSICPSVIVTDINREKILGEEAFAYTQLLARVPIGRWGEMEDLAGALLLFASDASAYITGQALYIDGGLMAS